MPTPSLDRMPPNLTTRLRVVLLVVAVLLALQFYFVDISEYYPTIPAIGKPQNAERPPPPPIPPPAVLVNATQGDLLPNGRVNATIVILIRNSELDDLIETLQVFEKRFNHRFGYPYTLLNEVKFTKEFKQRLQASLPEDRLVEYGFIPAEHWSYPAWIDQNKAREDRAKMAKEDIPYGGSEPYRHMCRYQSGFFFREPLTFKYKYYWRVEPGTRLLCDVPYDPFLTMVKKRAKYGFTISIYEYDKTVPTLYPETKKFADQWRSKNPDYNPPLLKFFENEDGNYNMCHFWSNFEIGSLEFLRSKEYTSYFDHLDHSGGFFYERWGDAPVHSLGVGLFLKKEEVIYYEDIGYYHNPMRNCPLSVVTYHERNCECDRLDAVKFNEGSCLSKWVDYKPETYFD